MTERDTPSAALRAFFKAVYSAMTGTTLGAIGGWASIVALPLSFFFYYASIAKPDVWYQVHAVRTEVVPAQRPSEIAVVYQGTELVNVSVVIARIAIWNSGRSPVRPDAILKPVILQFDPDVRVLRAEVATSVRAVSEVTVTSDEHSVEVGWRILEQGDGAIVEVIYAGPAEAAVWGEGVIEGQGRLRTTEMTFTRASDLEAYSLARNLFVGRVYFLAVAGLMLMILGPCLPYTLYRFRLADERVSEAHTGLWGATQNEVAQLTTEEAAAKYKRLLLEVAEARLNERRAQPWHWRLLATPSGTRAAVVFGAVSFLFGAYVIWGAVAQWLLLPSTPPFPF